MQLTAYSDYALRVLMFLGARGPALASIAEISEAFDISRNHLMKVVQHLGGVGVVETVRGRNGGLRLARAPESIRIGAVFRSTETFALAECFTDKESDCPLQGACALEAILHDALERFFETLDAYTVADLLKPRSALHALVQIERRAAR